MSLNDEENVETKESPVINYDIPSEKDLANISQTYNPNSKMKYKCDICEEQFNFLNMSQKHFYHKHYSYENIKQVIIQFEEMYTNFPPIIQMKRQMLNSEQSEQSKRNITKELRILVHKIDENIKIIDKMDKQVLKWAPTYERKVKYYLDKFISLADETTPFTIC